MKNLKNREGKGLLIATLAGLACIILLTVLIYIVRVITLNDFMTTRLGWKATAVEEIDKRIYFQILSCIPGCVLFLISNIIYGKRSNSDYAFTKIKYGDGKNGMPYVYNTRPVWIVLSPVLTFVAAFIIDNIAFNSVPSIHQQLSGKMYLPWIIEMVLMIAVYFIPFFKPLKED